MIVLSSGGEPSNKYSSQVMKNSKVRFYLDIYHNTLLLQRGVQINSPWRALVFSQAMQATLLSQQQQADAEV